MEKKGMKKKKSIGVDDLNESTDLPRKKWN